MGNLDALDGEAEEVGVKGAFASTHLVDDPTVGLKGVLLGQIVENDVGVRVDLSGIAVAGEVTGEVTGDAAPVPADDDFGPLDFGESLGDSGSGGADVEQSPEGLSDEAWHMRLQRGDPILTHQRLLLLPRETLLKYGYSEMFITHLEGFIQKLDEYLNEAEITLSFSLESLVETVCKQKEKEGKNPIDFWGMLGNLRDVILLAFSTQPATKTRVPEFSKQYTILAKESKVIYKQQLSRSTSTGPLASATPQRDGDGMENVVTIGVEVEPTPESVDVDLDFDDSTKIHADKDTDEIQVPSQAKVSKAITNTGRNRLLNRFLVVAGFAAATAAAALGIKANYESVPTLAPDEVEPIRHDTVYEPPAPVIPEAPHTPVHVNLGDAKHDIISELGWYFGQSADPQVHAKLRAFYAEINDLAKAYAAYHSSSIPRDESLHDKAVQYEEIIHELTGARKDPRFTNGGYNLANINNVFRVAPGEILTLDFEGPFMRRLRAVNPKISAKMLADFSAERAAKSFRITTHKDLMPNPYIALDAKDTKSHVQDSGADDYLASLEADLETYDVRGMVAPQSPDQVQADTAQAAADTLASLDAKMDTVEDLDIQGALDELRAKRRAREENALVSKAMIAYRNANNKLDIDPNDVGEGLYSASAQAEVDSALAELHAKRAEREAARAQQNQLVDDALAAYRKIRTEREANNLQSSKARIPLDAVDALDGGWDFSALDA